jgi:hypothetical protein
MTAMTAVRRRQLMGEAERAEKQADSLRERQEYFLAGVAYVDASDRFRLVGAIRRNLARILLERAGIAFVKAGPSAEKHGIAAQAKWERLSGMAPETEEEDETEGT